MNYINRYCRMALLLTILYLIIAGGMTGCTFKHVRPELVTAPPQKYSIIAVGNITMEDKLWDYLIPHFRRGFVQGLAAQKAFETVLDPAPEKLEGSSLLLSGKITEVNKGSTALRWIVGFGAGRAKVSGVFEIFNNEGVKLVRYEAGESYAGGAGIGGADYVDIGDLMERLGKTVAERTARWSRGEKIDE